MQRRSLAIGAAALALLGAGIWIGRSTSPATADRPPDAAAARAPAKPQRAELSAIPSRAPRPTLARPASSAADPGLAADLRDADPKIRRAAVRELARDDNADPTMLLAASRDADLEVGYTATIALGELYARGAIPVEEMVARATDRGLHDRVRYPALAGLGRVASPEAARVLVDLLARGNVVERRSASGLLAHQDPEIAVPALIGALADADEFVRENAVNGLRARARGRDFGTDAAAWQAWWQSRAR